MIIAIWSRKGGVTLQYLNTKHSLTDIINHIKTAQNRIYTLYIPSIWEITICVAFKLVVKKRWLPNSIRWPLGHIPLYMITYYPWHTVDNTIVIKYMRSHCTLYIISCTHSHLCVLIVATQNCTDDRSSFEKSQAISCGMDACGQEAIPDHEGG